MSRAVIVVAGVALFAGVYLFWTRLAVSPNQDASDPHLNAEYTLAGRTVRLANGSSDVEAAPGSAATIATRYFGQELHKDLNGDGREDVAFLITQQSGGSGTFYYLVAALDTENGVLGSEGFLLGDRIEPQATESGPGRSVIVRYLDRLPVEPFAAPPTVGTSKRVVLDSATMHFDEVPQDP